MSNLDKQLDELLKKYGSVIVDNAIAIIDNPDHNFKRSHDKAHAKAKAELQALITKEIKQARLQELYNYLNDAPAHPPAYIKKRIKKLEHALKRLAGK